MQNSVVDIGTRRASGAVARAAAGGTRGSLSSAARVRAVTCSGSPRCLARAQLVARSHRAASSFVRLRRSVQQGRAVSAAYVFATLRFHRRSKPAAPQRRCSHLPSEPRRTGTLQAYKRSNQELRAPRRFRPALPSSARSPLQACKLPTLQVWAPAQPEPLQPLAAAPDSAPAKRKTLAVMAACPSTSAAHAQATI
jgi:hypothetical protein